MFGWTRRVGRRLLATLLSLALALGSAPGGAAALETAGEPPAESFVLDFGAAAESGAALKDVTLSSHGWQISADTAPGGNLGETLKWYTWFIADQGLVFNPNDAQPRQLVIDFQVPEDGEYRADLYAVAKNAGGSGEVYIDGKLVGKVDSTGVEGTAKEAQPLDAVQLSAGIHTLKLVVTRESPALPGYWYLCLDRIAFERVIEEPPAESFVLDFGAAAESGAALKDVTLSSHGWQISADTAPGGNLGETLKWYTWFIADQGLVFNPNDAQPRQLVIDFMVPGTGNYRIDLYAVAKNAGGSGRVYIDGGFVGEVDSSGTEGSVKEVQPLNTVFLRAGVHTLTMEVTRESPALAGYWYLCLDRMELTAVEKLPAVTGARLILEKSQWSVGESVLFDCQAESEDGRKLWLGLNLDGSKSPIYTVSASEAELIRLEDGRATGKKAGACNLTLSVAYGDAVEETAVPVTVSADIARIWAELAGKLYCTESQALRVFAQNSAGTELDTNFLSWSYTTSDSAVLTVDSRGVVTGGEPGTAQVTVTATAGESRAEAMLDITVYDNAFALIPDKASLAGLERGELVWITLTGSVGSARVELDPAAITAVSSDESVVQVQVSADGRLRVTAGENGSAQLRVAAVWNGTRAECVIPIAVEHREPAAFTIDLTAAGVAGKELSEITVEQDGWALNPEQTAGADVALQGTYKYPIQWGQEPGAQMALDFWIPVSGYYGISLLGAFGYRGAVADVYIDGSFAGQFDFWQGETLGMNSQGISAGLNTMYLSKGVHTVVMRATQVHGEKCYIHPRAFTFTPERKPELRSAVLSSSRGVLSVGERARLSYTAFLTGGGELRIGNRIDGTQDPDAYMSLVQLSGSEAVRFDAQAWELLAEAPGVSEFILSATYAGVTKTASLSITVDEDVIGSASLSLDSDTLRPGETGRASVKAYTTGGRTLNERDLTVVYTSEQPEIARVLDDGTVQGVSAGTAQITAQVSLHEHSVWASVEVTVLSGTLSQVEVSAESLVMKPDSPGIQLQVRALDAQGAEVDLTDAGITYESLQPDIAQVDPSGWVTPGKTGSTGVRATVTLPGGESATGSAWVSVNDGKTAPTYYTEEKRTAAEENTVAYDWGRSLRQSATAAADRVVENLDRYYQMPAFEGLPRAASIGYIDDPLKYTCPLCGTDLRIQYGYYSWIVNALETPWKIQCPDCRRRFPSNDFGAYYQSGLDR